mgnify:CR=1 FL=1
MQIYGRSITHRPVSLTDRSERDRPSGSALNMFARNSITMGAGDKQQQQARVR